VIFRLLKNRNIKIGRLGRIHFKKGYYFYIGRAPRETVSKRISRHRQRIKKLFWHIDYLSSSKYIRFIKSAVFDTRECTLAEALGRHFTYIDGFGSSDCNCVSHLFYSENLKNFRAFDLKGVIDS